MLLVNVFFYLDYLQLGFIKYAVSRLLTVGCNVEVVLFAVIGVVLGGLLCVLEMVESGLTFVTRLISPGVW